MRLGSFKKPGYALFRTLEVHSRGVKAIAVWKTPEISDPASKRTGSVRHNIFVITGSYDGTVKVLSYKDLECIYTFNTHSGGVWDVKIYENLLASCGTDGKVAVLELSSGSTSLQLRYKELRIFLL